MSKHLKPYYARITVLPTPVDEVQHENGLILPIDLTAGVERGVVEATSESHDESPWGFPPGTIVYYFLHDAVQIGEVQVVKLEDVIAYEEADT